MKTRLASRTSLAIAAVAFLAAGSPVTAQKAASTRPSGDRPQAPAVRQAVPRGEPATRPPARRHPRSRAYVHYRGHYVGWPYWGGAYGWGYRPWGWGWTWGTPYPYSWRAWPAVPVGAAPVGGLDLNVRPKKTQVFVDGVAVGTTGRFDGFPSYLWLPSGTHELIFYREGFATVVRTIEVPRGGVIDVGFRMEPGESIPPEELMAARAPSPRPAPERPAAGQRPAPPPAPAEERRALDLRGDPARFRIAVEPTDASIYMDGRFLGTGEELARLHAGMMVDPGEHELQVVRPGYLPRTESVSVEAGEELELTIVLEPAAGE